MAAVSAPRRGIARLVDSALAGHAAIGLIAGALMYVIALSGTLAVVFEHWQRWEQPLVAETPAISPQAVQHTVESALAADAGKPASEHLFVHLPTDDLPRTVVTTDHGAHYVDAAGNIVAPEAHGWTEFLLALHINLNLPITIGILIVGALGSMLAALAITGVIAHPRIFRDAFRMRVRGGRQLAQADWHNRLGVWTLPFTLTIAITGAAIGLSSIGATMIAKAYHGGDLIETYGAIFGGEPEADPTPAPVANVAAALEAMQARFPDVRPTYVTIEEPGTAGQRVLVLADHARRLIYGETYRFDAAGHYLDKVGLSDGPLGRQAAASTYKLHFGNFGGIPVELAYVLFGLAMCVVSATGMSLWLQKRARRGLPSPRLEGFWKAVVWGAPILIVVACWMRFAIGPKAPFAALFWIGLAVAIVGCMVRPEALSPVTLRRALGAMIGATAIVHLLSALTAPLALIAIDVVLLAVAAVLIGVDRVTGRASTG
ncbi:MAG TPA: PepSY domain-containing protein [Sphingomonas sp.]|nr:PepSY domain-containing protein [Sphingomonas sp.]